jgi:hypothetical protein
VYTPGAFVAGAAISGISEREKSGCVLLVMELGNIFISPGIVR